MYKYKGNSYIGFVNKQTKLSYIYVMHLSLAYSQPSPHKTLSFLFIDTWNSLMQIHYFSKYVMNENLRLLSLIIWYIKCNSERSWNYVSRNWLIFVKVELCICIEN